jgi:hypothetical protein
MGILYSPQIKDFYPMHFKNLINMRKLLRNIFITFSTILFISCVDEIEEKTLPGIDFGISEYFDSFLFNDSKNEVLNKSLKIKFNDWAVTNNADVTLSLVNHNGDLVASHDSGIKLKVNDTPAIDGKIELLSSKHQIDTIHLQLIFPPSENSRTYDGYIQLENGNIERINNINKIGPNTKIFQWTARQEVLMNPLKKGLIWTSAVLVSLIIIWFIVLRNMVFPKMGNGQIILDSPYYKAIKTKGKREIIFTHQKKKQKTLNRIFAGKILYEQNSIWEEELKFTPASKKQIRLKLPLGYSINPFSSKLKRGSTYSIHKDKEHFKISYI